MSLLAVQNLCVNYDSIRAVKGISFKVEQGETVSLIGANGAGKTTTLKTLTGLLPAAAGEMLFDGKRLNGMPAYEIAALNLALVPEGRGIFTRMTVLENLLMGAYRRNDQAAIQREIDEIYTLLPRLAERGQQQAGKGMYRHGQPLRTKGRIVCATGSPPPYRCNGNFPPRRSALSWHPHFSAALTCRPSSPRYPSAN